MSSPASGPDSPAWLSWRGTLPWFSPLREGGPGTPLSLVIQAVLALFLGFFGVHLLETRGMDSGGPPLILLGIGWGLFLVLWLLLKGVLRGRDVEFILSEQGVEVRPSSRQVNLDRGMKIVTRVVFLLTYRGGQWSEWHPATRWKEIRQVEQDEARRHIVLRGGAWTIRLVCGPEEYGRASEIIQAQRMAATAAPAKSKSVRRREARPAPSGVPVAAGPGGWGWLMRIGLPLVLLAALAGVVSGSARWAVGFIPGLQGMLAGGVLGWLAGRRARAADEAWWSGGQRFWLWLNMTLTCGLAGLAMLSFLQAPPLAGPLEWLVDVAGGYAREPFLGARAMDPIHGLLGGGWWIGFNVLDLALFFFLGLVVLGATVRPRLEPVPAGDANDAGKDESSVWGPEEADEGEGEVETSASPSPPLARRLLLGQWILTGLVLAGLHAGRGYSSASGYDPAARMRLEELTGRFVFDDGRGLLAPAGTGGVFTVQVWGGSGLFFRPDPDGAYGISLDGRGRDFRGRMYRGSSLTPVRARFSKDGGEVVIAGPAHRMGRRAGDVEVVARREERQAAGQGE